MDTGERMDPDPPVSLLWTGGWDSTFRLLQLLLEHRLPVQPLYLLDDTRASSKVEIATMERLRAAIARKHPHTRYLLRPLSIVRVADLAPDPDVEAAHARLAVRDGIGSQYDWLARFARQHGTPGIELTLDCIQKGASGVLLDHAVHARAPHGYPTYRVPADEAEDDVALLFGRFAYPLIGTTREEMRDAAERKGWSDLMASTWFCHRPANGGQPCGLCHPCRANIEEGFGWRIPPKRRALSAVYRYTLLPFRAGARRMVLRLRLRMLRPAERVERPAR